MSSYDFPDARGRFGAYGGVYVADSRNIDGSIGRAECRVRPRQG